MHIRSMSDFDWQATTTPGSEKYEIWRGGPDAYMVAYRFKAGTVIKAHAPLIWEQLTVISGRWQLNDHVLGPGDVAVSAPNEEHQERALEDTVVIVSIGNKDLPA